jgi:hypothetical protein
MGGYYQDYLNNQFNPAKNAAIGTMQGAINEFDNSALANALRQMSDPNYKAMSDEYVGAQRVAGAQAIGRGQANAIAAGLQPGENRLLVEVSQAGGGWGLYLRFEDADGTPLRLDDSGELAKVPLAP